MTETDPESVRRSPTAWAVLSCLWILVLAASYLPVLQAPLFEGDDPYWIDNAQKDSVLGLLLRNHFIGWRPVAALTFLVGTSDQLWLVHAVDLLLLAALLSAVLLVSRRALRLSFPLSLMAVTFAGLHPALEEVVPIPSSRADLLVALFGVLYLGSCVAQGKTFWRLTWLALALGSKENAFALVPAAFIYAFAKEWKHSRGRSSSGRGLPTPQRDAGQDSGIHVALLAALKRCFPDLLVTLVFFLGRWLVLGEIGGYAWDMKGALHLIPLDYLLGVVAPHTPFFFEQGRAVLAAMIAVLGGSTLLLLARKHSPVQLLLVSVLVLEALLYLASGLCFFRLLPLASAVFALWLAERASRDRLALACALVIGTTWSALHLASQPWQRLGTRAAIVGEFMATLRARIDQHPSASHVYVLDLPAAYLMSPLERRPCLFFGNKESVRTSTADWYQVKKSLVHPTMMGRIASLDHQDRNVYVLPMFMLQYDHLSDRHEARLDGPPDQGSVNLDITHCWAAFTMLVDPPMVSDFKADETSLSFSTGGLRKQPGRAWLLIGTELHPIPEKLTIHFHTRDTRPPRFRY